MMHYSKFLMTFLVLALPNYGFGMDRSADHASRLDGLDLSLRSLGPEMIEQANPAAAAFSDFAVSWSLSPARFTQDNASVCALQDDGWLTAWDDNRLGASKIFWQRLDSLGVRIGGNQLIAGSTIGTNCVEPKLAIDSLGRVCLFYRDQSRGLIFGARFGSDLSVDIPEFLVNDTTLDSFAGPFDMEVYPNGRIVVVWENYSAIGSDINVRVYNAAGVSVAGPVAVNSEGGGTQHWFPATAIEPGSGFVVAWEDYRNGQADIYARLFSGDGAPIGTDFAVVPPPDDAASQFAPNIGFAETDKYIIGWIDQRLGQEIYAQRFDPNSGLVGTNQLISNGNTLISNQTLDMAISPDDKLLASWGAFGADNSLLALRFNSDLTPIGSPQIHNQSNVGRRWSPSVDFSSADKYGMVWTEFQDENADIHFMLFDSSGTQAIVDEIQLNLDSIGAPSSAPDVAASTDWYDLITWVDRRNDAGDIYLEAVSNAGVRLNGNTRVNQDTGPDLQSEPSLAVSDAKSLVVWIDGRPLGGFAGQRIFGRFASLFGVFFENEFVISDTNEVAIKSSSRAAMTPSGQGLVVWIDKRSDTTTQVWGRWLATDGSLDGNEFQISSTQNDLRNTGVHIGVDSLDRFFVIWLDDGGVDPAVKGKWYGSDKIEGGSFNWVSTVANVDIDNIVADINEAGETILLWSGAEGSVRNVYLTRLASDGSVLNSPFEVNSDPTADVTDPAVSVCEDGYVSATWVDRRTGTRQVYYQIFDNSMTTIGVNEPISTATPEYMESPATAASRGRAWFTWADPRANGLNIYASNIVYLPTGVDDDEPASIPSGYHLSQNYPNPFNPTTTIKFSLPATTDLTVAVFNLLGREVTILAEGTFPAGEHRVIWDGTNRSGEQVANGVYFYQLKTPTYTERRKMMMLK